MSETFDFSLPVMSMSIFEWIGHLSSFLTLLHWLVCYHLSKTLLSYHFFVMFSPSGGDEAFFLRPYVASEELSVPKHCSLSFCSKALNVFFVGVTKPDCCLYFSDPVLV